MRYIHSILICLFCLSSGAYAQGDRLPSWLTAEEQRSIEKEKGEKDRVEVLLKVSATRLNTARNNIGTQEFERATGEIKNYGALVVYTSAFIENLQKKEKDKRKLYKIVDLSLRRDLNALEGMRFELPEKYANEALEVYERVRKVREVALGALFGKDFFPAKEQEEEKNSLDNPAKDN